MQRPHHANWCNGPLAVTHSGTTLKDKRIPHYLPCNGTRELNMQNTRGDWTGPNCVTWLINEFDHHHCTLTLYLLIPDLCLMARLVLFQAVMSIQKVISDFVKSLCHGSLSLATSRSIILWRVYTVPKLYSTRDKWQKLCLQSIQHSQEVITQLFIQIALDNHSMEAEKGNFHNSTLQNLWSPHCRAWPLHVLRTAEGEELDLHTVKPDSTKQSIAPHLIRAGGTGPVAPVLAGPFFASSSY